MKNFNLCSLMIVSLLICFPFSVLAFTHLERLSTRLVSYAGVDAGIRYSPFDENFGGNLFKKQYPEGNVYFGLKLTDYIGIEIGYKKSVTQNRTSVLGSGEVAVGQPIINPPVRYKASANFKGWHGNLIGFFKIQNPDCVLLFGSIGLNRINFFAKTKLVEDSVLAYRDLVQVNTFSDKKNIVILGGGVQIALDERTSIRGKISWENTSHFNTLLSKENSSFRLKLKNNLVYGIGIIVHFL